MMLLKKILRNICFFLSPIILVFTLNSCAVWDPADARKVSPNADERVKKNLEEGKGFSIMGMGDSEGGGAFQFASSNPMWRATLEILDFLPLSNVDYSGGIIITEWFSENSDQNSVKISIRFLSNEIRADGLKVIIYNKICKKENRDDCKITQDTTTLGQEIKLAILKKAAIIKESEKEDIEYSETGPGRQEPSKY